MLTVGVGIYLWSVTLDNKFERQAEQRRHELLKKLGERIPIHEA